MKLLALSAIFICVAQNAMSAVRVEGGSALALAALVGAQSPRLPIRQKRALSMLFGGSGAVPPRMGKIGVRAESIICRSSDVDISAHSCTVKFGPRTIVVKGRAAHELYATLIEAGVPSDGAAGSIFESLTRLDCVVDPRAVEARAGAGATCVFSSEP